MTHEDINDLPTRDYIFKIGDRGKGIQARYDENTDAIIFPRAAFDYVYKLLKEALSQEPCIYDLKNRYCPRLNEHGMLKYPLQEPTEKPMCDRNICISNEYNGIGCDECIVNKAEQEPCEDAEQIDYHDDFETASRKIHDYEERQKQSDKKCGSYNNTNTFKSCCDCKLIGTDSCYMVCGGSKSLYKPKQKSEPCDDAISREAVLTIASMHTLTVDETVKAIKNLPSVTQKSETETWNGMHGQITAPKGTFKKIWEDAESEDKE